MSKSRGQHVKKLTISIVAVCVALWVGGAASALAIEDTTVGGYSQAQVPPTGINAALPPAWALSQLSPYCRGLAPMAASPLDWNRNNSPAGCAAGGNGC
jgi:hypothetical protein